MGGICLPKIEITEDLDHKINRLAETMGVTPEELIDTALNSYLNERCDKLNRKMSSDTSFPETKYTPSK